MFSFTLTLNKNDEQEVNGFEDLQPKMSEERRISGAGSAGTPQSGDSCCLSVMQIRVETDLVYFRRYGVSCRTCSQIVLKCVVVMMIKL